jgi:glycosyltransferase involved in cell wall biosynthesis
MSRIAVVTSSPPLTEGGHLVIARSLVRALEEAGHEAGLVATPQNRFGRQASAYLATWLTDIGVDGAGHATDQVISLRFPSYAVRHERHVCWLNHRMREYYDRWDDFRATLSWQGQLKEGVRRRAIHTVDRYLLTHNVTRLLAQSNTIQARLQRWGGIPSDVVYPPPPQRPYRCDGYGDYVFAVSRLTALKRLSLLIEALARPEAAGIACFIAGDGEQRRSLEHAIETRGLSGRVHLLGRIDDRQLLDHLAGRRLRLRDRGGLRVAQAGHHVHRQRGTGRARHRRRQRPGLRAATGDDGGRAAGRDGRRGGGPAARRGRLRAGVEDDLGARPEETVARLGEHHGLPLSARSAAREEDDDGHHRLRPHRGR